MNSRIKLHRERILLIAVILLALLVYSKLIMSIFYLIDSHKIDSCIDASENKLTSALIPANSNNSNSVFRFLQNDFSKGSEGITLIDIINRGKTQDKSLKPILMKILTMDDNEVSQFVLQQYGLLPCEVRSYAVVFLANYCDETVDQSIAEFLYNKDFSNKSSNSFDWQCQQIANSFIGCHSCFTNEVAFWETKQLVDRECLLIIKYINNTGICFETFLNSRNESAIAYQTHCRISIISDTQFLIPTNHYIHKRGILKGLLHKYNP